MLSNIFKKKQQTKAEMPKNVLDISKYKIVDHFPASDFSAASIVQNEQGQFFIMRTYHVHDSNMVEQISACCSSNNFVVGVATATTSTKHVKLRQQPIQVLQPITVQVQYNTCSPLASMVSLAKMQQYERFVLMRDLIRALQLVHVNNLFIGALCWHSVLSIMSIDYSQVLVMVPCVTDAMDGAYLRSSRYVAPEQIVAGKSKAKLSRESDIFALGVMMFELACSSAENDVSM